MNFGDSAPQPHGLAKSTQALNRWLLLDALNEHVSTHCQLYKNARAFGWSTCLGAQQPHLNPVALQHTTSLYYEKSEVSLAIYRVSRFIVLLPISSLPNHSQYQRSPYRSPFDFDPLIGRTVHVHHSY